MAWVGTICILLEVEDESEAMDAVAETMRPLLKTHNERSCIRDWQWAQGEDELIEVNSIPAEFRPDDAWPWKD